MRIKALLFGALLFSGAGCLGHYSAPPTSSSSSSSSSGGDTGTEGPPVTPTHDGGAHRDAAPAQNDPPSTPAASPDAGATPTTPPASPACNQLGNCCGELPPEDALNCDDAVNQATDDVCQAILDQLQQNGLCL